jgi:hypothetical protein
MLCSGVRLPALRQLMGQAHIETTLVYSAVSPLEVYQQYARAGSTPQTTSGDTVMNLSRELHCNIHSPVLFHRAVDVISVTRNVKWPRLGA